MKVFASTCLVLSVAGIAWAGPVSIASTTTISEPTSSATLPSQPVILDAISLSEHLVEQSNSTHDGVLSLDIPSTFQGIRNTVNLTLSGSEFIPRPHGWPADEPWLVGGGGKPVIRPTRIIPLLCKRLIICPPYGPQVTDPVEFPNRPTTVSGHPAQVTDPVRTEFLPPVKPWPPIPHPGDPPRPWDVKDVLLGLGDGTLPILLQDPDVSRAVAVETEDLVGFAGVVAEAAILWRAAAEEAPGGVVAVRSEGDGLEKRIAVETVVAIIEVGIWIYETFFEE